MKDLKIVFPPNRTVYHSEKVVKHEGYVLVPEGECVASAFGNFAPIFINNKKFKPFQSIGDQGYPAIDIY